MPERPVTRPRERAPGPAEINRFERARIIGARALQIAMGAPVLFETEGRDLDPVWIAEEEWRRGLVPVTVRRPAEGHPPSRKRAEIVTRPGGERRQAARNA